MKRALVSVRWKLGGGKKPNVCQGSLKEALKIDTDASLMIFLLLSRRSANERLLVRDSYLAL